MPTSPTVMISSTLYDLAQVRADLVDFLERDFGFRPLLSELHSFPVDPDLTTIENCRRRVDRQADLMVLLIGGRYGSREEASSRSITNIEYLAAKAKGIPIYTFIKKSVLTALPIWKKNPDADLSDVVDDSAVFDFVVAVRESDQSWTFEFELAQDIVRILRSQFSYLFAQGLEWSRRLRTEAQPEALKLLSGHALRTALEKTGPWEYQLFADLLMQELEKHRELRHFQRLGIVTGPYQFVRFNDLQEWGRSRLAELLGLVKGLEKLMNDAFQEATGQKGTEGNIERIVYCARGLGLLYAEAIEWSLSIRRTTAPDEIKGVIDSFFALSGSLITTVETMGTQVQVTVDEMREEISQKGDSTRALKFSVDLPGADEVSRQLDLLLRKS